MFDISSWCSIIQSNTQVLVGCNGFFEKFASNVWSRTFSANHYMLCAKNIRWISLAISICFVVICPNLDVMTTTCHFDFPRFVVRCASPNSCILILMIHWTLWDTIQDEVEAMCKHRIDNCCCRAYRQSITCILHSGCFKFFQLCDRRLPCCLPFIKF